MNELLGAESFPSAARGREVTIFFADVRGFTTLTMKCSKACGFSSRAPDRG